MILLSKAFGATGTDDWNILINPDHIVHVERDVTNDTNKLTDDNMWQKVYTNHTRICLTNGKEYLVNESVLAVLDTINTYDKNQNHASLERELTVLAQGFKAWLDTTTANTTAEE
jgi:uncharacterized protein YlzI (FlbEa/FlbD family)